MLPKILKMLQIDFLLNFSKIKNLMLVAQTKRSKMSKTLILYKIQKILIMLQIF
jgi:hypothetical protein